MVSRSLWGLNPVTVLIAICVVTEKNAISLSHVVRDEAWCSAEGLSQMLKSMRKPLNFYPQTEQGVVGCFTMALEFTARFGVISGLSCLLSTAVTWGCEDPLTLMGYCRHTDVNQRF